MINNVSTFVTFTVTKHKRKETSVKAERERNSIHSRKPIRSKSNRDVYDPICFARIRSVAVSSTQKISISKIEVFNEIEQTDSKHTNTFFQKKKIFLKTYNGELYRRATP